MEILSSLLFNIAIYVYR